MLVPKQVPHPQTDQPSIAYSVFLWRWENNQWQLRINQALMHRALPDARSAILIIVPALVQELLGHLSPPPPYSYLTVQVFTNQGWVQVLGHGNWMPKPSINI